MKTLPTLLIATLLTSYITAAPVFAADTTNETESAVQPFAHPSDDTSYSEDMRDDELLAKTKPMNKGQIQYTSGGVAVSGMRAIDAEEHLYNLKMLFVSEGEYLAGVDVHVTDSKGKDVLDTTTNGPVLLVKMPRGRYTVIAKAEGRSTMTRHVEVGSDHLTSYVLRYPAIKR